MRKFKCKVKEHFSLVENVSLNFSEIFLISQGASFMWLLEGGEITNSTLHTLDESCIQLQIQRVSVSLE